MNLCACENDVLGVCLLQNGKVKDTLLAKLINLLCFAKIPLSFNKSLLRSGLRKIPEHSSLHNARYVNVTTQCFQTCGFPLLSQRIQKSNRDFLPSYPYLFFASIVDYTCLFFDYVQVLSAIADGRAGVNPHACRKPSPILSITAMVLEILPLFGSKWPHQIRPWHGRPD